MNKKYWIVLVIFIIFCIVFPFIIELLYQIGDEYPIIKIHYSAGDILSYCASVLGLILSIAAICISLKANEIDIHISHATTISENNKDAIAIDIYNNNPFDCHIDCIDICNKKKNRCTHIIRSAPFELKAKSKIIYIIEIEDLKKMLNFVTNGNMKEKSLYRISYSLNKESYVKTTGLLDCLHSMESHLERLGKKQ